MLQGQAFFDNDSDSEEENEIEEVVEIRVPPGPLGLLLDSGIQQCAVVHGFTTLPTGGKGPIEAHGGVQPGMYIIGINETNASLMSLQAVTELLGKLARKEKIIRFAVFRPGSPKRHLDSDDSDDDDSDEDDSDGEAAKSHVSRTSVAASNVSRTSSSASARQQQQLPPVPVTMKPPPAAGGLGGFTSRFASLAATVTAKTSTPRGGSGKAPSLKD
ncbi:hypothetical protein PybrP1_002253 [[Pythium] brassicae (nom. inval.)]|nr:hypothetical protein PybrP1_002253 [[Pythium] brassicae (nom. inval.)]